MNGPFFHGFASAESFVNNATSWTDRPRNPVTLAGPNAVVPIAPVPSICLPPSGRRSPLGLYPTTPFTAAGIQRTQRYLFQFQALTRLTLGELSRRL